MTIATYDDLVAKVKDWCARTDSNFSAQIPDFIGCAEQRIFYGFGDTREPMYSPALRSRDIETNGTITMSNGEGSLPSDFLDMRVLSRANDTVGFKGTVPRDFRPLSNQLTGTNPYLSTIEGNTLKVVPSYSGQLSILYWAKPAALTSSNQSNTVLSNSPAIYLHATLIEAFDYMRDTGQSQTHLLKLIGFIKGANKTDHNARYSAGTNRIRTRGIA